jgi:putative two-component system response regulator
LLSTRLNSEETRRTAKSEQDALRSAQDLLRTRDAVIFGLAKLAESRDPDTGHHLERISLYSTRLANALRALPEYQSVVTPSFVRLLGISSVLHDIGKVGLEDNVLLKPGRLNAEERSRMQEHTLVAGDCLREIEQRLGASNFLQTAREIALYHHERWDGNGYPMGLSGEEIPLSARIVTVADVYDALSSKRVYKDAFPHDECVRLIREGAGTQFDPDLVRVFLSIEAEFAAIAVRFASAAESRDAENSSIGDVMSRNQEAVLLDVAGNSMLVGDSSRSSSVA